MQKWEEDGSFPSRQGQRRWTSSDTDTTLGPTVTTHISASRGHRNSWEEDDEISETELGGKNKTACHHLERITVQVGRVRGLEEGQGRGSIASPTLEGEKSYRSTEGLV